MTYKVQIYQTANDYFEAALQIDDDKRRIVLLKQTVQLDNNFAEAYLELGHSYRNLNKLKKAESMFKTAISLNDDGWGHLYLGNLFFTKKDWDGAAAEFRKGRRLLPNNATPIWCLADVYRAKGDIVRSESFYRMAVKIEPSSTNALARLGRLLLEENRKIEGTEYIKQALEQDESCRVALKWKKQYKIS
jgi:tetratricopeptide (TPR) repeat protein